MLDGDPTPPSKKGAESLSPIFGPFLLWPNGWMHQDATYYGGRPQPWGLCVRLDPAPLSKRGGGQSPQFSAHVYCGQTAVCIKMPLGMEVGLGPGDIVLDGAQLPVPKMGTEPPPQFVAHMYCGQTAGWIKMAHGNGGRPRLMRHCVRWGPSPSPKRGWSPPPIFGPFLFWPND